MLFVKTFKNIFVGSFLFIFIFIGYFFDSRIALGDIRCYSGHVLEKSKVEFDVRRLDGSGGLTSVEQGKDAVRLWMRVTVSDGCIGQTSQVGFSTYYLEQGVNKFVPLGKGNLKSINSDPDDKDDIQEYTLDVQLSGLKDSQTGSFVSPGGSVAFFASFINIETGELIKSSEIKVAYTEPSDNSGGTGGGGGTTGGGQTPNPSQPRERSTLDFSGGLSNPIKYNSAGGLIEGVIKFLLALVGALSVLFIIIGGIRLITAAGDANQVTAGKKTITWAVIGMLVALLAYTLINIVRGTI